METTATNTYHCAIATLYILDPPARLFYIVMITMKTFRTTTSQYNYNTPIYTETWMEQKDKSVIKNNKKLIGHIRRDNFLSTNTKT